MLSWCGLPADSPHDHAQSVALADVQQEDADGAVRATITTPIHVPAGESLYLAIITTTFGTAPRSVEPTGDLAPRAMWWGVVDNDCDGAADAGLVNDYTFGRELPKSDFEDFDG